MYWILQCNCYNTQCRKNWIYQIMGVQSITLLHLYTSWWSQPCSNVIAQTPWIYLVGKQVLSCHLTKQKFWRKNKQVKSCNSFAGQRGYSILCSKYDCRSLQSAGCTHTYIWVRAMLTDSKSSGWTRQDWSNGSQTTLQCLIIQQKLHPQHLQHWKYINHHQ